MGLTQNLGRLSPSIFSDASLNIGVGAAPSGSYKFEVTGTSKVSGVLTLGATISNGTYTYTLPAATGTLALTSALSGYLPLSGGTLTGALNGTSATFSSTLLATGVGSNTVLSGTGLKVTSSNANLYLNFSPSFTGGVEGEISSSDNGLRIVAASTSASPNSLRFLTSNSSGVSTLALTLSSTQTATFSSGIATLGYTASTSYAALFNGNVGIGTSSPSAKLQIYSANGTAYSSTSQLRISGGGVNNNRAQILFSDDALSDGKISYYPAASTIAYFSISARSSEFDFIINGLGNTVIGGEGSGGQGVLTVRKDGGIPASISNESISGTLIRFSGNGSGVLGSISHNGTSVAYNTSSDYRLKEDLKEIKGLEKLSAIKVYDFKWKNNDARMDGVLAHELQEVIPYAVNGDKDGLDKDGKEFYQGVDYSKLVPIMVKAIQEQQATITELTEKVNRLYIHHYGE